MNDFINPMLGLNMDEEQKRRMMGMALLSGGGATLQNANKGMFPAMGAGVSAMMGSLDQQQQIALSAQLQALQRKNMESQMQARTAASDMAEKQMGLQEKKYGLQEKQYGLQEREIAMQQAKAERERNLMERRQQEAKALMKGLPEDPQARQQELARRIATFQAAYGGSLPTQAGNVLMPSGATGQGGMSPFAELLGGGMGGEEAAPVAPVAPPKPNPAAAPSLSEGIGVQGDIDVAKQAAKSAQRKQLEATFFVQRELIPAGSLVGGESSKEGAEKLISRASEMWDYMRESDRAQAVRIVKHLKDKFKL